jgi:hypothetical protein
MSGAVDSGASVAPGNSRKKNVKKRRNTMSEESKKIEKAEKTEQEVKPAELSDKDLEQVAGGATSPDPGIIKGGATTIKFLGS